MLYLYHKEREKSKMSKLNITIKHELGSNEIVAETYISSWDIFTATAKCSPEDTFDFTKGVELATKRVRAKALAAIAKRDFEKADQIYDEIEDLKKTLKKLINNAENCSIAAMELRAELRDEGHHE